MQTKKIFIVKWCSTEFISTSIGLPKIGLKIVNIFKTPRERPHGGALPRNGPTGPVRTQ